MSPTILSRMAQELPWVRFKQTYGLSEVGVLMTSSPGNSTTWVKLVGENLETKVEDGILWLKVPSMMLGQIRFENDEPRFVRQLPEWFCTHDMVETMEGGYFRFLGRVTDIINVSGLKVHPSEVESVILTCEDVANVVVFGMRSPLVGQVVAAQVELRPGAGPPASAKAKILETCRRSLDRFKVPQYVEFVDAIAVSGRLKKRATTTDDARV